MAKKPAGQEGLLSPQGGAPMPERVSKAAPAKVAKAKQQTRSTERGRGRATQVDERTRETRAQETREDLFSPVDEDRPYERPTSTEAPPPRSGFKQRWIRVGFEGKVDERNLAQKLREGWRARRADSVPRGFHIPRIGSGRFAGTVMVEGLMLCEMPVKLALARARHIRELTQLKTDAVNENLMRINEGARGGFGPIKKGEKTQLKPTKPAPKVSAQAEGDLEEAEL